MIKNIILALLLMPLSLLGDCNEILKEHAEELKDEYEFKLLKLSSIGKMIQEKEELIESLTSNISTLRGGQEANSFNQSVNDLEKHILAALMGDKNSMQFITQSYALKKSNNERIDRIETGLIRIEVERIIWQCLIEDYKKCLLELFEINQECNNNKKKDHK